MKMYGEDKLMKSRKPANVGLVFRSLGAALLIALAVLSIIGAKYWEDNVRALDIGGKKKVVVPAGESDLVNRDKNKNNEYEGLEVSDKRERKEDFYNILIVGTDLNGYHTDSIMLASFDIKNKKLNVLSIPRDTIINVKRSNKKINAAFAYDGNPGNVSKLYEEIESVIGFQPDGYVIVSTQGFVDMIDAIGGVEVDVQRRMKYSDPTQDLYIDIQPGLQTLDGYDSMCFMRYRYGYVEGDIGRVRAQQQFVRALTDKMLTPSTLGKLPELVEIVVDNVETDLTFGNFIWFGTQVLGMDLSEDLNTYILPGEGLYYQKLSYYFLYPRQTEELINEVFNPYTTPVDDLDILNYTELTGKPYPSGGY